MKNYDLARMTYHTYGAVTGFKNFQGNSMPNFDDLTDVIKDAWWEAAQTAYNLGYARASDQAESTNT